MFLYRVKVEELDAIRLKSLHDDLTRGEDTLRAHCPIREMNLVSDDEDSDHGELDIYLALDDFLEAEQLQRLFGELNTMIDCGANPGAKARPRVSTELIGI